MIEKFVKYNLNWTFLQLKKDVISLNDCKIISPLSKFETQGNPHKLIMLKEAKKTNTVGISLPTI
jgi:hypothetical protein